jgi:ATP synthase protein I
MDIAKEKKEENKNEGAWSALSLAWQLGYTIAIPIVVLALVGRILDKRFGTSPWLLLAGIFISLFLSTIAVYYKTINIIAETDAKKKDNEE